LGFAKGELARAHARISHAISTINLPNKFSEFFLFSPAYKCAVASARGTSKNRARLGIDGRFRATVNPDQLIASVLRRL
jgi:hypothetical protein